MALKPGETILCLTTQVDAPDQFRLKRGDLVTFMGQVERDGRTLYAVMCHDGKIRLVFQEEVQEHDQ